MSSVRLKKLSKFYGYQEILKGIDLEVKSGEFLVLVGPSVSYTHLRAHET